MLEYRSVEDMNRLIIKNLNQFKLKFDLIVGVPRSGMLPATLLALYLNLPVMDLDTFVEGGQVSYGERMKFNLKENSKLLRNPRKVLVVDDSVYSGTAILKAKNKINKLNNKDILFIYAAIYVQPSKYSHVDIWLESLPFRIFEWNIMNSGILENACVDIDGILCRDPSAEENDDGFRYQYFLQSVEPLNQPVFRIGWLITCRLEKYRVDTEMWLAKHKIHYKNLIMLDLPSKKDRIAKSCHADFKAKAYQKTEADCFIESNYNQATRIAKISRKPVFCYETRQMLYHDLIKKLKILEFVRLFPHRALSWIARLVRKFCIIRNN